MLKANEIYLGDCLEVMQDIPDKSIQLIILDPPYFETKGDFDFIWKSFEDYLKDVEKWALACKRVLADNGTMFWFGSSKRIAYTQVILDKCFNLVNSLVWENTQESKQSMKYTEGLRSFAPLTERILMYSNEIGQTGLEMIMENNIKPLHPFGIYLREEFKKAGVTNKEISKLFPSNTGGLTGCVSNWLNGDNVITEEQYLKIRKYLNNEYLRKEYEELRKEYEELRKEYEELRRPFNNKQNYGDVIRLPNYETCDFNHDTVKPLALYQALIETCSREGDTVLDPMAGSGTTGVICKRFARKYILIEKEAKFVKIIKLRLRQEKSMFDKI